MRNWILIAVLLLPLGVFAGQEVSLEQLKARAEQEKSDPRVFLEIARRQLSAAEQLYNAGETEKAQAAVEDVASYSERAAEVSRLARKRMKGTEIALRKISKKLEDIRRSVSVEDRPALGEAIERLEKVRSELLGRMFAKD